MFETAFPPERRQRFESTNKNVMSRFFHVLGRYVLADDSEHPEFMTVKQLFKDIHVTLKDAANNFRIA